MQVNVLASGSKGNVTAVDINGDIILLDCGKSVMWTLDKLNYQLPKAVLITHEHSDHSKATVDWLKRGVGVFATLGTIDALRFDILTVPHRHNLHLIYAGDSFELCNCLVTAIPAAHDAAEPVSFILQDDVDRILYATDIGLIPKLSPVFTHFTQILIEANYDVTQLLESDVAPVQKRRILDNHLSIDAAIHFLKQFPDVAEIHLIHISKRHGDKATFRQAVQIATAIDNVFAH